MTFIAHAVIGATIAYKINNPYLAGSLSVISHFLCDMIPHWDLGTFWRNRPKIITGILAIIETVIAVLGTYIVFNKLVPSASLLMISIFFSLVPDWLEAPYFMFKKAPKFFYYVYKFQSYVHMRLKAPAGIFTQIAVVGIFLYVAFAI